MSMVTEREMQQIGKTRGAENHDHDLIHELSRRLDSLWRYDQYIANAQQDEQLHAFWEEVKTQEQKNVKQLKQFIVKHVQKNCF